MIGRRLATEADLYVGTPPNGSDVAIPLVSRT
jgi:hypothetical protein